MSIASCAGKNRPICRFRRPRNTNWSSISRPHGRLGSMSRMICFQSPTRSSNECARQSWCDPAGESPAQVRGNVRLVASVAWSPATVGCEAYAAIAWGVGLSHERSDVAGAEGFHSLEGNMCGTVMRGADALPGSKATSLAKGSHRNLGGLGPGRRRSMLSTAVRMGKARSRSR
jgi:hypothetical protein